MRSQYTTILVEWGDIPLSDILYAGIFQWLLLAGYLVLPGTFASLQKSDAVQEGLTGNGAEEAVLHTIQNPPLLAIACALFLVGLMGMAWLCFKWKTNYIWLAHFFQTTFVNATAGLVSTFVNVFSAQKGYWSIMAFFTVATASFLAIVSLGLLLYTTCIKLVSIKARYKQEL